MKKQSQQNTDTTQATQEQKQSLGKDFLNKNKEPIKAIDAEDKIELERREAYIEPNTRDLLREILECCDNEEIIPKYFQGTGFVYQVN